MSPRGTWEVLGSSGRHWPALWGHWAVLGTSGRHWAVPWGRWTVPVAVGCSGMFPEAVGRHWGAVGYLGEGRGWLCCRCLTSVSLGTLGGAVGRRSRPAPLPGNACRRLRMRIAGDAGGTASPGSPCAARAPGLLRGAGHGAAGGAGGSRRHGRERSSLPAPAGRRHRRLPPRVPPPLQPRPPGVSAGALRDRAAAWRG